MRKTIVGLVAVLVMGGCGSTASGEPEPAGPGGPSPTAAAETDAATFAQWASLIAPFAREWDEQVSTVDEACGDVDTLIGCNLGYLTLGIQAETYVVVLDAAQNNQQHDDYLGEPPAEIARLVEETADAAAAVQPSVDTYSDTGCGDPLDTDCAVESIVMRRAVGDLTAAFDAWAPYM